ncbi:hypothetical protein OEZ85_014335 [Tetradesmus obliquus]|uniref:Uncharacterized protein n=1 Tax=Tetradesmus obliquus TaxID=3088 RepID=A0ABY8U7S9_TETOB|nr:hypothetical protein OEZ85_014335 [Tetradesmus obliquus]
MLSGTIYIVISCIVLLFTSAAAQEHPSLLLDSREQQRQQGANAADSFEAAGTAPAATTGQCSNAQLVSRGCYACNPATMYCSKCKPGYILRLNNVNCLALRCCNMVPKVPAPFTVKMLVAPGATRKFTKDFDLLSQVQDEDPADLKLAVWNVTKAWGSGLLLRQKDGRISGVWRFTANPSGVKANSALTVRYNVTDGYGAVGAGLFYIRFSVNAAPVLGRKTAQLSALTAGVTATYPVRDFLKLLKATDATPGDQNNLKIPYASLVFKDRGDKLAFKKPQAAWEYYCPSDQPCADYLGNKLNVTVTDGLSNVTGLLTQPVKPRPALFTSEPVPLQGDESPERLRSISVLSMSKRGFAVVRIPMPSDMEAGSALPDDAVPVKIPQASGDTLLDAIEFYGDVNQDSVAQAQELPLALADKNPYQTVLGIICMANGSGDCAVNCIPDDTGEVCIEDPNDQGGGGGGTGDPYELHGWLVPPTKTTAIGFWISLGCKSSGNISIEWDAANDEDFDGLDSDKDERDDDKESDPRRDNPATTQPGRRLRLFTSAGGTGSSSSSSSSSSSDGKRRRRLLQARTINGKSSNACYADDLPARAMSQHTGDQQDAARLEADSTDASASAAAAVAGDHQDNGSSSGSDDSSGGSRHLHMSSISSHPNSSRRHLLSRTEVEKEPYYCSYYVKQTSFSQPAYDCEVGSTRRVGVFVSAWVGNTAAYLRQVRLQSNVEPGGDPSMYVGTLFISQTQLGKQQDPWLPKGGARKRKRSSSRRRALLGLPGL